MCSVNVDANPGAVTRHMQENLCPCQKLKITVISGFRTKITVVTNYRATITVQSIPWLPITVHQLLCNTVVAAYRGKRYRDEKSLPRKALFFFKIIFFLVLYAAYFVVREEGTGRGGKTGMEE